MTSPKPEFGAFTPEALVTEEVKKICLEMRPIIEKMNPFKGYIPLTFRSQIVNGTNYLVKVYVDVNTCVHAMIYQATNGGKPTVTGDQYPKTASDPLIPFLNTV